MTQGRIVRVIATDDPRVTLIKPDPTLRFVMGRFAPARYDPGRVGYVVPTEHMGAFEAFARLHAMVLVENAYTPPGKTSPAPPPFHAEPMTDHRQAELAASAKRGAALCRIMLRRAALIREREAGQ